MRQFALTLLLVSLAMSAARKLGRRRRAGKVRKD